MAHPARKTGKRPPKNAPAIHFRSILSAVTPAHPASADYLLGMPGWAMLGNDAAGNCVAVTWANFRRLVTMALTSAGYYPSIDQVWAIYKTQNPGFDPNGSASTNGPGSLYDQGMDIQTLLEYLVKTGGPDGVKALAFAKVNFKSLDDVKAAMAIFGGVWIGCNVTDANQQEFEDGKPWDFVPTSPVEGGHSVLGGGYGATTSTRPALKGDAKFITWADETSMTDAFWQNQVDECWVVIWPEHLGTAQFLAGINLPALAAAYQALTGNVLPIPIPPAPTPTPAPTPPPTPAPVPVPVPIPPAPASSTSLVYDQTAMTASIPADWIVVQSPVLAFLAAFKVAFIPKGWTMSNATKSTLSLAQIVAFFQAAIALISQWFPTPASSSGPHKPKAGDASDPPFTLVPVVLTDLLNNHAYLLLLQPQIDAIGDATLSADFAGLVSRTLKDGGAAAEKYKTDKTLAVLPPIVFNGLDYEVDMTDPANPTLVVTAPLDAGLIPVGSAPAVVPPAQAHH